MVMHRPAFGMMACANSGYAFEQKFPILSDWQRMDKAESPCGLESMGLGFSEEGAVTWYAQPGTPPVFSGDCG